MSNAVLDFPILTAPLDGEQTAGVRLPADLKKKMEDARKEFEPHPDDPSKPPILKKPDWSGIIKLATETLAKQSKDLLAAARLVEALAKRDGFAGLREGLKLLRLLATDCWDRMHPIIEGPEDVDVRAGPFQWLTDAEGGAWFPASVRRLPLLRVGSQTASLQDCRAGKLGDQPLSNETIQASSPVTPTTVADIAECLQELDQLDKILVERMSAQHAPSLGGLRDVLSECQTILSHLHVAAAPPEAVPAPDAKGAAPGTPKKADALTNRNEAYQQLALLAENLAKMEPHSPIPDLLRWAVKLGKMSFRELLDELVREPNVLADIRRQFGIEPEKPEVK